MIEEDGTHLKLVSQPIEYKPKRQVRYAYLRFFFLVVICQLFASSNTVMAFISVTTSPGAAIGVRVDTQWEY